jgi:hypothetical protein
MTGKRRFGTIARGLLVVAALALLPLAGLGLGQGPRTVVAQAAAQDSLWAGSIAGYVACANPSSPSSLAGCFSSYLPFVSNESFPTVATDGVNVYFATELTGGYSCPIADLVPNCSRTFIGPFPGGGSVAVTAIAAADGQVWIGQDDGQIFRCSATIPFVQNPSQLPSGCVLLDDAVERSVDSLLLANGRLYAGLGWAERNQQKNGILWSCDPQAVNSCENLDLYGDTTANSLAAGGGYLWAGLDNGIIWRCDLNAVNACADWESAGYPVESISYDGEGTLYAAIQGKRNSVGTGVIWSCPVAAADRCSSVLSNVNGASVAAGAGGVFSSTWTGLNFGTSAYTAASSNLDQANLLYVPAGGVTGVGGVSVALQGGKWADKLGKRCTARGKGLKGSVQVTGPGGHDKTVAVNLCALAKGGSVKETFDLLDQGTYTVKAATTNWKKRFGGSGSVTVDPDRTSKVKVRLTRSGAGK